MSSPVHRLAAIMFTDIVGYTSMMGEDEGKALELLRLNNELHAELTFKFRGKVWKEIGDGTLTSFDSVLDAIYCAISLSRRAKEKNIPLKISIHQGEVVFLDQDIYGDGVNIASRILDMASGGEILISETVHINIRNKIGSLSKFRSEQYLKNVTDPVKIYSLEPSLEKIRGMIEADNYIGKGAGSRNKMMVIISSLIIITLIVTWVLSIIEMKPGLITKEASIAVIPFRNYSQNKESDYIGLGFASELRTTLSQTKQFDFITAEQATIGLQNSREDLSSIGGKLKTSHILSGNYQILENKIKVNVELMNVLEGNVLWTFNKEGELQDLWDIQNMVSEEVLNRLSITPSVNSRSITTNLKAFKHYQEGRRLLASEYGNESSTRDFRKAIELDSLFAQAYIDLIFVYSFQYFNSGFSQANEGYEYLKDSAIYLLEYVNSNFQKSTETHLANGIYQYYVEKDFDLALNIFLKIINEDSNNFWANNLAAAVLKRKNNLSQSYKYRIKSIQLNPLWVGSWQDLFLLLKWNGDYTNAAKAAIKYWEINPEYKYPAYNTFFALDSLYALPQEIKNHLWRRYLVDSLYLAREMQSMLYVLDTISTDSQFSEIDRAVYKSKAFYCLGERDSSRYYAGEVVKDGVTNFQDLLMLCFLDEREEYLKFSDDLLFFSIFNNYEATPGLLKEYNRNNPEIGDYYKYKEPLYDRIKKEYPPFREALNELTLPSKLVDTYPFPKY